MRTCTIKVVTFLLQALLTRGVNIEAQSKDQATVLMIASQQGHLGVVEVCSLF